MGAGRARFAILWLLASAEVFATAKRIESGKPWASNAKGSIPSGSGLCLDGKEGKGTVVSKWKELAGGLFRSKGRRVCSTPNDLVAVRGGNAPHSGVLGLPISLSVFKIILQLLLTGLNIACWLVPMRMKRFSQNKDLISLANAFSGGVFLSLAFGHMLPHSLHGFEALDLSHNLPFFVSLGGYLLIFFVEKIAFDAHALMEGDHHTHHHPYDAADLDLARNGGAIKASSPRGGAVAKPKAVAPPASPINSGRSALILMLALAIHSVFETMALGLADTPVQAGLLATSIALHQPAESIALLVAFLKSGLPREQIFRYLLGFSCVGVIGVTLGLLVNTMASEIWDSVFVALAAGTFIYVGCTEIVAEEFEDAHNKWKKFGALLAGVVIVGAITVVTEAWEH